VDNIIEILKLGLPGLVFLLAAFSYKLLAKEQLKKSPSNAILKSIKQYLYVNVFLAVLTVTSPIIDFKYFSTSKVLNMEAITNVSNVKRGYASVCHNAHYANRFLLIRDHITGKLVQVFSGSLEPCTSGKQHITLNNEDAVNLGWDAVNDSGNVEVVVALPGYKFAI